MYLQYDDLKNKFPTAHFLPYNNIYPKIAHDAFIADGAVIIGDVIIESKCSIWFNTTIRGDVDYIRIGANTNIQDGCVIHVATNGNGTVIGERVTVGHMALIHACHIDNDAFIGMKSCAMDFSYVKRQSILATGALLTIGKTTEEMTIYSGAPAKKMRDLKQKDCDRLTWSWQNYVELGQKYLKEIS